MATHNKTSRNTRLRVLESASAVFAEKGYRDATIAEICEHAGANVASVNYYFGNKRQLYDRVWRHAYRIANETHPLDAGLNDKAPLDECLYAFVSGMLRRIFTRGPAGHFCRLMAGEMAEPTRAHKAIVEEAIRHDMERLEGIVKELLGRDESGDQVRLCASSVITQCLFLNFNRSPRKSNFNGKGLDAEHIEVLARHITRFSLAGIREVKRFAKGNES
jgi:AcrR family transcriptional regulator